MRLKALAAVAVAMLALAGCSVDKSDQDSRKQTIRIAYQSFPSGDLIVKNNGWLEEALPDYTVKWTKFDSGADVNTAFIAEEVDFGALGSSPVARWGTRTSFRTRRRAPSSSATAASWS